MMRRGFFVAVVGILLAVAATLTLAPRDAHAQYACIFTPAGNPICTGPYMVSCALCCPPPCPVNDNKNIGEIVASGKTSQDNLTTFKDITTLLQDETEPTLGEERRASIIRPITAPIQTQKFSDSTAGKEFPFALSSRDLNDVNLSNEKIRTGLFNNDPNITQEARDKVKKDRESVDALMAHQRLAHALYYREQATQSAGVTEELTRRAMGDSQNLREDQSVQALVKQEKAAALMRIGQMRAEQNLSTGLGKIKDFPVENPAKDAAPTTGQPDQDLVDRIILDSRLADTRNFLDRQLTDGFNTEFDPNGDPYKVSTPDKVGNYYGVNVVATIHNDRNVAGVNHTMILTANDFIRQHDQKLKALNLQAAYIRPLLEDKDITVVVPDPRKVDINDVRDKENINPDDEMQVRVPSGPYPAAVLGAMPAADGAPLILPDEIYERPPFQYVLDLSPAGIIELEDSPHTQPRSTYSQNMLGQYLRSLDDTDYLRDTIPNPRLTRAAQAACTAAKQMALQPTFDYGNFRFRSRCEAAKLPRDNQDEDSYEEDCLHYKYQLAPFHGADHGRQTYQCNTRGGNYGLSNYLEAFKQERNARALRDTMEMTKARAVAGNAEILSRWLGGDAKVWVAKLETLYNAFDEKKDDLDVIYGDAKKAEDYIIAELERSVQDANTVMKNQLLPESQRLGDHGTIESLEIKAMIADLLVYTQEVKKDNTTLFPKCLASYGYRIPADMVLHCLDLENVTGQTTPAP